MTRTKKQTNKWNSEHLTAICGANTNATGTPEEWNCIEEMYGKK